jgi:hypothetical protein
MVQPSTIGHFVSSGCIRLTNEDVEDLYNRVTVGTRVVVLPGTYPVSAAQGRSRADAKRQSIVSTAVGFDDRAYVWFSLCVQTEWLGCVTTPEVSGEPVTVRDKLSMP